MHNIYGNIWNLTNLCLWLSVTSLLISFENDPKAPLSSSLLRLIDMCLCGHSSVASGIQTMLIFDQFNRFQTYGRKFFKIFCIVVKMGGIESDHILKVKQSIDNNNFCCDSKIKWKQIPKKPAIRMLWSNHKPIHRFWYTNVPRARIVRCVCVCR